MLIYGKIELMDLDTKFRLIDSVKCTFVSMCNVTLHGDHNKAIPLLQSYLDQNIISQEDLYAYYKIHAYDMRNSLVVLKWFVEQIGSFITEEDVLNHLILQSNIVLTDDMAIYPLYASVVENMDLSMDIPITYAFQIFAEDKFIEYLNSKSMLQMIDTSRRYSQLKPILKKHMIDRIDELKDVVTMNDLFRAVEFIKNNDITDEIVEYHIHRDRYAVFNYIIKWVSKDDSSFIIKHIIAIYERVTNEDFVIGEDKYSIYFGMVSYFKWCHTYHICSGYATESFIKIKSNIYLLNRIHNDIIAKVYQSELDSLKKRLRDFGDAHDKIIDFRPDQIDPIVNDFNQLVNEIVDFMNEKSPFKKLN